MFVIYVSFTAPDWGIWSPWSQCSLVVDLCQQDRTRMCDDPDKNDPIDCIGDDYEQRECQFGQCGGTLVDFKTFHETNNK